MQIRDEAFFYRKNKEYFNSINMQNNNAYIEENIGGDIEEYKDYTWDKFENFCNTIHHDTIIKDAEWYYDSFKVNHKELTDKQIKLNTIRFYLYERLFRNKYSEYKIIWDVVFETLFESRYMDISIEQGMIDYNTLRVLRLFQLDWRYYPPRKYSTRK